ncbi:uncharacterized protein LOC119833115 [Zerene cesonia]|uniref:uncharacterized protein LOC119833115 n=1 Tax=Zerene cesonia TaxID=33412 RepID=UPI0018E51090|nr:uncharacterized protein LOC119833115 [Zerene cesonia]XP_038212929.1 uncharacterized protein LOC119833115 [Zerene cesonia]
MHFNGRCFCMEVETGCLIWAIFTTIITGIATLLGFGFFIYMNIEFAQQSGDKQLGYFLGEIFNIIAIFILCLIIISFTFSVHLLVGVVKKRPHYIKAYFIYGVVVFSILVSIYLVSMAVAVGHDEFGGFLLFSSVFISILGFYGLILHMIRMTYLKFNGDLIQQYTHKLIV